MPTPRGVGIVLFEKVELFDLAGPFEVFSVASRLAPEPEFSVFTVAERPGDVTTNNGLVVRADHGFDDAPPIDLLVVSGGQGTRIERNNPRMIEWVKRRADQAELVLSVCTGSLLLGAAGLLDGLEATTHHASLDLLAEVAPRATVVRDRRYVDNGRIIVSAGVAAGVDMAFHVVARILGRDHAARTAAYIEYPWGG